MIKEYDWICTGCGKVTVTWYIKNDSWDEAFGLARHHIDSKKVPGDYDVVVSILVKNGKYELLGFLGKDKGPIIAVYKSVFGYLDSLGLEQLPTDRVKRIA